MGLYDNLLITTWRTTYNRRKLYNAVLTSPHINGRFASGM